MDTENIGPAFIIGLSTLLLGAFFIARHLYLDGHPPAAELPSKMSDQSRTLVQAAPEITPPSDPSIQRQVLNHVYQCVDNGQRVFSDSPCSTDAKSRAIQQSNTMPPPALVYSPGVNSRGPARSDEETDEAPIVSKKKCAYLEEEVERLNERMRRGYGSAQGERLHEEYRVVSSQLDDCKRHGR